jgi:phage shock protein PspC (stress-responsive transcriptional regulator)
MNTFNGSKQLYRRREGRIIAGVCAGLADYFGVDPTIARLVFALLTVFGGSGILLYLLAWLVIPEEGEKTSLVADRINRRRDR